MAFYDENEDEQDQDLQGGVATGPQSSTINLAGGTSAPNQPGQQQNAPDKGSNFVGISQYLNANKPQAAKLGDQTAGVITNSANQARTDVSGLQNEANQKIQSTSLIGDDISNKLNTGAESLSQDERGLLKNTAAAQYKGPKSETDLTGFNQAQKSTKTATQNIDNSGTEQGRMNLVSQLNNKPRTQGMNVFDNALLQAGGGREKLAQAANANKDIKDSLGKASEGIRTQIGRPDDPNTPDVDESSGAIGQTNKAQKDAYDKIQGAMSNWQKAFQPKVQNARDALLNQQKAITGDLTDDMYSLDQSTLDLLGLQPGQYSYNLNLGNYVNQLSPDQINASNVADQTDYARYAALADLAGVSPEQMMLKSEDAAKAGTAPKLSANREKLAKDLADAEAESLKRYDVGLTKADQDELMRSSPNIEYGKYAQNYDDLQNMLNSVKDAEWTQYGGTAGTSFRNIQDFLDKVSKSRNPIKRNA